MAYYLTQSRRAELMRKLESLGIPSQRARDCASFGDDLKLLDAVLSSLVGRLGERCQHIKEAAKLGNEERLKRSEAMLWADLLTFRLYALETVERRLPSVMFPRTTRAVQRSLNEIGSLKVEMATEIIKEGFHQ